jgi:hypothetical protein
LLFSYTRRDDGCDNRAAIVGGETDGSSRGRCQGDGIMTYDADEENVDLLDHLLSKQRRHAERRSSSQGMLPAIKMLVGDWYIDEFGVMTREITARD